jgi:hypothetical protein
MLNYASHFKTFGSFLMKIIRASKAGARSFYAAAPNLALLGIAIGLMGLIFVAAFVITIYQDISFKNQSPTEHLSKAKAAVTDREFDSAVNHLLAIPANAPVHETAVTLLKTIQQKQEQERTLQAERKTRQSEEAYERLLGNRNGKYNDPFNCSVSTANAPIMSFDNGTTWWLDDGRCALREQQKKNQDASLSSYVPTTIRVDTDMDSFWLNNEERNCQTYPDNAGRVAVVGCNATGNHREHNIPVRFWGGVDRNTVSNWKCRRESENYVCRAID